MPADWTRNKIVGLSPDYHTSRNGITLGHVEKWRALHCADEVLWGTFETTGRVSVEVVVNLSNLHFSCTCRSQKFPCSHLIGFLLVWLEAPDQFLSTAVPPKIQSQQLRVQQLLERQRHTKNRLVSPKIFGQLHSAIDELERWLTDIMQAGLASLPDRPQTYWSSVADRMADAQAIRLAAAVQDLVKLNNTQPDWPEHYLRRLGPLGLLVAGFKQYDQLPLTRQADLLEAMGILINPNPNGRFIYYDRWLVLGRQYESLVGQHQMVTWLWGLTHDRPARLVSAVSGPRPAGITYPTGMLLSGELRYLPGTVPLTAVWRTTPQLQAPPLVQHGQKSFVQGVDKFAQAKAQNPWLVSYPLWLRQVTPRFENGRWRLTDLQNYTLPLPQQTAHGWHLQAFSGGQPIDLFGCWDGEAFDPLSVYRQDEWIDLRVLRGVT